MVRTISLLKLGARCSGLDRTEPQGHFMDRSMMALRYDSVDTPPNAPVAPAPATTPVLRRRAKAAGAVATSGHAGQAGPSTRGALR